MKRKVVRLSTSINDLAENGEGFVKPLLLSLVFALTMSPVTALAQNSFTFTTIDVPDSTSNRPYDINDVSDIVGLFSDQAGIRHGYLLRNGQYKTIDVANATFTSARDINNPG